MESQQNLILGSSSPSRIDLLKRIFNSFEIIKPDIEEPSSGFSSPREQVAVISWLKGQEVSLQVKQGVIIAADTIGWIDGKPLLKPIDREDAKEMISRMSGRNHELWTGVVLCINLQTYNCAGRNSRLFRLRKYRLQKLSITLKQDLGKITPDLMPSRKKMILGYKFRGVQ